MGASDDIIARAEDALRRHSGTSRLVSRARARKLKNVRTRFGRIVLLGLAIALAIPFWGLLIGPVGVGGVIAAALAFILGTIILSVFPRDHADNSLHLPTTELAKLPLNTEEWLANQRKLLPAPAQRLVDGIGIRLETLSQQLGAVDEKEPVAAEVRRLVARDLPELVSGYTRVPSDLRRRSDVGSSPDQRLVDGLNLIDAELDRMSQTIAAGDINSLATQARYLEIKYQDPQ